jgi:uncharacterized membrane protein/predicted DsbA family dithiol-disulfide isomerase
MSGAGNYRSVSRLLVLLGLVGFGISIYALALHIKSKAGGASLDCDVNDHLNCSKVLGGDYGEFLSIPLGGYGMAYFAIVMVAGLLPMFAQASQAWHARMQLFVTGAGAVVVIGLAALSAFVIKSVCMVCSAVHVTALIAFVVALISFLKVKSQPATSDGGATMKFISTSLATAVPALLAGLIAPMIAPQFMNASSSKKPPALDNSKPAAPETLLSVSRSRYVGKGEDFRKGNDQAKVVVQMFSDFQCPHCKITAENIEAGIKKVGADKVLFVYRNYPLSNACNPGIGGAGHTKACLFAEAARCAGQQGKFWEVKQWAFAFIGASESDIEAQTTPEAVAKQVAAVGVDAAAFDTCMKSDVELDKIRDDVRIGNELGLKGTPLVVVNNRIYEGPREADDLALLFKGLLD